MTCVLSIRSMFYFFFFFNDTATTEIYTLSLHDALPISDRRVCRELGGARLPNLLLTAVVLVHQLDGVPVDLARLAVELAVQIVDRQLRTVLAVQAEVLVVTGDRQQREIGRA